MLIVFHLIQLYLWNLMNKRKDSPTEEQPNNDTNSCNFKDDTEIQFKFDPPVYVQRYQKVQELIINEKWRKSIEKVVDFGCAEFGLFIFLKRLNSIKEILFVDIDDNLLMENIYKLEPLIFDHVQNRQGPLELNIFSGSISTPDPNLSGCDAVLAVEIIEHLYPDILDALPYNIFGFIAPKLVIITTPNADFNVVFKKMGKFRHFDHKFEWTREQFQDWSLNCCCRFPNYTVEFFGCGEAPLNHPNIGYCSQIGLFLNKDLLDGVINCDYKESNCISYGVCTYMSETPKELTNFHNNYKKLHQIIYPHVIDERTENERILDEIKYRLNMLGTINSRYFNIDKEYCEIPLENLIYNLQIDINELKTILINSGYTVDECLIKETDESKLCILHVPESIMENSDTSECNSELVYENGNVDELSDWDNEENVPQKDVEDKKQPDPLFDSGYQKSSIVDDSPQSPSAEELDSFDESPKNDKKFPDSNTMNELHYLPNKPLYIDRKLCKEAVPGPSRIPRRQKKSKQASTSSDSEEEGYWEDVRSIANCLLENTLNKIDADEDEEPMEILAEQVEEQQLVENGDLANNNRDLEGNNYVANEHEVNFEEDEMNDNLDVDEGVVLVEENNNDDQNIVEEIIEEDPRLIEQPPDVVALASREALFDSNSEQDLLLEDQLSVNTMDACVVGVRLTTPDNYDGNSFPSWLLQILGTQDVDGHDEPHFYCQGDGLGVHPSIVVEDDDSSTSGSNRQTEDDRDVTESEFSLLEAEGSVNESQINSANIPLQTDEYFDAISNVDTNPND